MLLFWESGSIPSGWTEISSTYNNQYPRGDSVADVGDPGTDTTHTPTATVSLGAKTGNDFDIGGATPNLTTSGHSHSITSSNLTVTAASNSDDFVHCTLRLIRYDAGIPNVIPNGAIAMFDNTPGVPASGWTRQSSQDSKMIKVSTTAGTCSGTNTHTHTITAWPALGAASGTVGRNLIGLSTGSGTAHTHTAPVADAADVTSDVACSITGCLPPYVEPLMAKKTTSDSVTIPVGMIAMFDGAPGAGWGNRSDTGGTFHENFLRPQTCGAASPYTSCWNGTEQGAETHDHNNVTSTDNSGQGGNAGTTSDTIVSGIAAAAHRHFLVANFDLFESRPDFFNVVIAEKISFTQNTYRWYVDPDPAGNDNTVSDPWGNPDLSENQSLTVTPVANDAPPSGRELRLRINMTIGGVDLPASNLQFKLQYRANTDMSCTDGTWTDVGAGGGGSIWRYATSNITDGGSLTAAAKLSTTNVKEQYIKSSASGTNPLSATVGQNVEYDFHIQHNGATTATQYSFRIIETTDIFLSVYSQCPTLHTLPAAGDQLRHGGVFIGGSDQGFTWAD